MTVHLKIKQTTPILKTVRSRRLQKKDITIGEKFGRLTVQGFSPARIRQATGKPIQCICECGTIVYSELWRLKHGDRKSCGCLHRDTIREVQLRTRHTQNGLTKLFPREYKSYSCMLTRCYKKNTINYSDYGGSGIKVCKRWRKGENGKTGFACFIEDMGKRPFNKYSLDREDPTKGYYKDNCRWASIGLQANNKKNSLLAKYERKEIDLKYLCKSWNIKHKTAKKLLNKKFVVRDLQSYKLNIMAIDPGTTNFAVCWIKHSKVRGVHMLNSTISELSNKTMDKNIDNYMKEIELLLDIIKPTDIVIERFVVRGFGAKISELISFMIGILANIAYKKNIRFHLITAGQWKTASKHAFSLEEIYKSGKIEHELLPHPLDAMCMGRYVMSHASFHKDDKLWITRNIKNCRKLIIKE